MLENILNLGKTVLPEYAQGESSLSDSLSSKGRSKETFEGEQWNPIGRIPENIANRLCLDVVKMRRPGGRSGDADSIWSGRKQAV